MDGILQLLDIVLDTLGALRRKLRVNELTLYVHIGGSDDPAKAAMGYGRAWAAIGAITPSLERLFVIKKRDIRPALDYTISNTQVDAHLVTTITIGRSLAPCAARWHPVPENSERTKKGGVKYGTSSV